METRWKSVRETAELTPFTERSLRQLIFDPPPELAPAISRPPGTRRVLLDMDLFEQWLEQGRGAPARTPDQSFRERGAA